MIAFLLITSNLAFELIFFAERKQQPAHAVGARVSWRMLSIDILKVGTDAVHFVDERNARHIVFLSPARQTGFRIAAAPQPLHRTPRSRRRAREANAPPSAVKIDVGRGVVDDVNALVLFLQKIL